MKVALSTVDLFPGRERLMPWRTMIEVAKYLKDVGHEVILLSAIVQKDVHEYIFEDVQITPINRDTFLLCKYIREKEIEVLVYPTPWREGFKKFSDFEGLACKKIAYIPGGVYAFKNIISLISNVGIKTTIPYLLDCIIPRRTLINKLKNSGFSTIIGLSPFTTTKAKAAGFENSITILPGKDDFDLIGNDNNVFEKYNIEKKKYLLFTGAPAPIRGAELLLKAFDKYVNINKDAYCVFLMRTDVGSSYKSFFKVYNTLKNRDRIQLIQTTLSRIELKTIISQARAVILPFLVIPSEIPLTYFEVLSVGTPIITFENGGTTEYLKDAVLESKVGSLNGLILNMDLIWTDENLHQELTTIALNLMNQHPIWSEVGKKWLDEISL